MPRAALPALRRRLGWSKGVEVGEALRSPTNFSEARATLKPNVASKPDCPELNKTHLEACTALMVHVPAPFGLRLGSCDTEIDRLFVSECTSGDIWR